MICLDQNKTKLALRVELGSGELPNVISQKPLRLKVCIITKHTGSFTQNSFQIDLIIGFCTKIFKGVDRTEGEIFAYPNENLFRPP